MTSIEATLFVIKLCLWACIIGVSIVLALVILAFADQFRKEDEDELRESQNSH